MEAGGFGNLFAVRQLGGRHQRCCGIGPLQAETGVLVAAQVVEGAQFPAGDGPIQVAGQVATDGGQVFIRGGGAGDERGADPQGDAGRAWLRRLVADMLQVLQDLRIGDARELGSAGPGRAVSDRTAPGRCTAASRSRVWRRAQPAGIQGGGDALLLQAPQERLGEVRLEGRLAAREGHAAAGFLIIGPVLEQLGQHFSTVTVLPSASRAPDGQASAQSPQASQRSRSITRPSAVMRQAAVRAGLQAGLAADAAHGEPLGLQAGGRGFPGCDTRRSAAGSP